MNCATIHDQSISERYLRGELAAAERDEFELHYFSCESCYSELEAMRLAGPELAQGTTAHRVLVMPKRNRMWWWAGAAAAACAVLMVSMLLRKPDPSVETARQSGPAIQATQPGPGVQAPDVLPPDSKLLALAQYDPPAYRESILRGKEPAVNRFAEAMRLYQTRDYKGALTLLESQLSNDPSSAQLRFFVAACRMLLGDSAGAERAATRAIQLGETPYLEEAYWLRAKARFAIGNWTAGRDDLRKLASLKGDWETKARQLLEKALEVR